MNDQFKLSWWAFHALSSWCKCQGHEKEANLCSFLGSLNPLNQIFSVLQTDFPFLTDNILIYIENILCNIPYLRHPNFRQLIAFPLERTDRNSVSRCKMSGYPTWNASLLNLIYFLIRLIPISRTIKFSNPPITRTKSFSSGERASERKARPDKRAVNMKPQGTSV